MSASNLFSPIKYVLRLWCYTLLCFNRRYLHSPQCWLWQKRSIYNIGQMQFWDLYIVICLACSWRKWPAPWGIRPEPLTQSMMMTIRCHSRFSSGGCFVGRELVIWFFWCLWAQQGSFCIVYFHGPSNFNFGILSLLFSVCCQLCAVNFLSFLGLFSCLVF